MSVNDQRIAESLVAVAVERRINASKSAGLVFLDLQTAAVLATQQLINVANVVMAILKINAHCRFQLYDFVL